jgi:hypothetical protein
MIGEITIVSNDKARRYRCAPSPKPVTPLASLLGDVWPARKVLSHHRTSAASDRLYLRLQPPFNALRRSSQYGRCQDFCTHQVCRREAVHLSALTNETPLARQRSNYRHENRSDDARAGGRAGARGLCWCWCWCWLHDAPGWNLAGYNRSRKRNHKKDCKSKSFHTVTSKRELPRFLHRLQTKTESQLSLQGPGVAEYHPFATFPPNPSERPKVS